MCSRFRWKWDFRHAVRNNFITINLLSIWTQQWRWCVSIQRKKHWMDINDCIEFTIPFDLKYWKCWQKSTIIMLSYKLNPATNLCKFFLENEVVLFQIDQSIGKCECVMSLLFVYFSRAYAHECLWNCHYFFFVRCNNFQAKSFFLTPFANSICFQTECKSHWNETKSFPFGTLKCECVRQDKHVHCVHNHFVIQDNRLSRDGLWFFLLLSVGLSAGI